jgi:queuosine precursor transporter
MHSLDKSYVFLSSLFAVTLVTTNMVFQKFIHFSLGGFLSLELSLGILLYPITFLISDLVTEVYGKKHANYMVTTAVSISASATIILFIFNTLEATPWSPVDNRTFSKVFGNYSVAIFASMTAVYVSQLLDVAVFAWIKEKTHNKHLWLRNITSTVLAQIVDTFCVTVILVSFKIFPSAQFIPIFSDGLVFKVISAILTIPLCYLGRFFLKNI